MLKHQWKVYYFRELHINLKWRLWLKRLTHKSCSAKSNRSHTLRSLWERKTLIKFIKFGCFSSRRSWNKRRNELLTNVSVHQVPWWTPFKIQSKQVFHNELSTQTVSTETSLLNNIRKRSTTYSYFTTCWHGQSSTLYLLQCIISVVWSGRK